MQASKAAKTQGVTGYERIRNKHITNEQEKERVIRTIDSD